jgi:hypothetical protein
MKNPLARNSDTVTDSPTRAGATPTDLPREEVHERRAHATSAREARAIQREEYGGFSWGSIFFGWLVAVGLAAVLTAILSGAGTAIGITELGGGEAADNAETVSLVGGILLLAVLLVSYYAGGYVAGRLARFDGARQGFGVWLFGVVVTLAFAAFAAIAGSEWNIFERLDLPRIPVDEGTLTTGGAITLAAIVIGTLLTAVAGGKVGERFHRRVDRLAFDRPATR